MSGPTPSPDGFQLRATRSGDVLTLTISGEVDGRERDAILAAMDSGDPPAARISFEVSGLVYMGSAGLMALLHALRAVEPTGGTVELVDPPAHLVRLLDTCGVTSHFAIRLTDEPA